MNSHLLNSTLFLHGQPPPPPTCVQSLSLIHCLYKSCTSTHQSLFFHPFIFPPVHLPLLFFHPLICPSSEHFHLFRVVLLFLFFITYSNANLDLSSIQTFCSFHRVCLGQPQPFLTSIPAFQHYVRATTTFTTHQYDFFVHFITLGLLVNEPVHVTQVAHRGQSCVVLLSVRARAALQAYTEATAY